LPWLPGQYSPWVLSEFGNASAAARHPRRYFTRSQGGFQRQGGRLKINATVDAEGIARLKQVLDKYEEILKLL
jgi:hypothetical protein